jgi:hypothetical protein
MFDARNLTQLVSRGSFLSSASSARERRDARRERIVTSPTEKRDVSTAVVGTDKVRIECERPDPWINGGFAPDFLVPAQFYDLTRRRASLDGETRLVFAILEDAVRIFVKNSTAQGGYRRMLFHEVAHWFQSADGPQHPFTFNYVCDVLDVDPDYLLGCIRSLKAEDLPTKQMRSVGRRHVVRAGRRSNRSDIRRRQASGS